MNYIKEINAFYDRLETNPLSSSAIALWYALMHINNKAGWIKEFAVAVSVLSVKTGLSERSITNARNELKQKEYIDFKSRKGNKSAIYRFVSANIADNVSYNTSYSLSYSVSDNASALIKLNKTKLNKTSVVESIKSSDEAKTDFATLYTIFEKHFTENGKIGPLDSEEFGVLFDDYGGEWLLKAMREAVRHRKQSLAYIHAILKDWKTKGVSSSDKAIHIKLPEHDNQEQGIEPPDFLGEGWT